MLVRMLRKLKSPVEKSSLYTTTGTVRNGWRSFVVLGLAGDSALVVVAGCTVQVVVGAGSSSTTTYFTMVVT